MLCLTLIYKTISVSQQDHILFVTGETKERESEVVDFRENSLYCRSLSDYPLQAQYASGGILNRQPLICGGIIGSENSKDPTSKCFIYNNSSLTWTLFANMTHKRYGASGIMLDDKRFLIMGGLGQTDSNITSEYIMSDGSVIAGHNIPDMGLEWHCIVKLEDGKVIIINQFNG